jgi:hypothetical protein
MNTRSQQVIAKLQGLSPEDLQKVLQFVETLSPSMSAAPERKSLRGLFAHRGIDITAEDIAEARKEAWANFPRDISFD